MIPEGGVSRAISVRALAPGVGGHREPPLRERVTPVRAASFQTAGSPLGQDIAPPPLASLLLPHLHRLRAEGKFVIRIFNKETVPNLSELETKKLHEASIVKGVSPTRPGPIVLSMSSLSRRRNGKMKNREMDSSSLWLISFLCSGSGEPLACHSGGAHPSMALHHLQGLPALTELLGQPVLISNFLTLG